MSLFFLAGRVAAQTDALSIARLSRPRRLDSPIGKKFTSPSSTVLTTTFLSLLGTPFGRSVVNSFSSPSPLASMKLSSTLRPLSTISQLCGNCVTIALEGQFIVSSSAFFSFEADEPSSSSRLPLLSRNGRPAHPSLPRSQEVQRSATIWNFQRYQFEKKRKEELVRWRCFGRSCFSSRRVRRASAFPPLSDQA